MGVVVYLDSHYGERQGLMFKKKGQEKYIKDKLLPIRGRHARLPRGQGAAGQKGGQGQEGGGREAGRRQAQDLLPEGGHLPARGRSGPSQGGPESCPQVIKGWHKEYNMYNFKHIPIPTGQCMDPKLIIYLNV